VPSPTSKPRLSGLAIAGIVVGCLVIAIVGVLLTHLLRSHPDVSLTFDKLFIQF
jgi:hypothetical protein